MRNSYERIVSRQLFPVWRVLSVFFAVIFLTIVAATAAVAAVTATTTTNWPFTTIGLSRAVCLPQQECRQYYINFSINIISYAYKHNQVCILMTIIICVNNPRWPFNSNCHCDLGNRIICVDSYIRTRFKRWVFLQIAYLWNYRVFFVDNTK